MDGALKAFNGMPATGLPPLDWRRSRRSGPQGNCVEFAPLPGGDRVAIRNSRDPDGPVLVHHHREVADLVQALKDGEFDPLL